MEPEKQEQPDQQAPVNQVESTSEGAELDPKQVMESLGKGGSSSIKVPGLGGKLPKFGGGGLLKKVAIIAGGLVIVLVILSIVVSVYRGLGGIGGGQNATPQVTLVPTPTPVVIDGGNGTISNPSGYANDPEVLQLIKQIEELDQRLVETDFKEDLLRVPDLDWSISF